MTSRFPFPAYRPPRETETGNVPFDDTSHQRFKRTQFASAEDRATLGSDPSADWSPANGRSGGFHTKAARLAHCRCRGKSDKSIRLFHPPPDGAHNGHLTAMIKIPPKRRNLLVINHLQVAMPQPWPPSTSTIPSISPTASPSNTALILRVCLYDPLKVEAAILRFERLASV